MYHIIHDWDYAKIGVWLGLGFFCVLFWYWLGRILVSPLPGWLRESGWL
jgi:hypothetical protein